MKLKHTDTMKDDNKPTPPEGYEVMQGKHVPRNAPADGLLVCMNGAWIETQYSAQSRYPNDQYPEEWFAVPNPPPSTDPKASQAIQKPQLQLIPPALNDETAKALLRGAAKYGFFNWRENKVEMMTYLGAMKRHIDCLIEGEDIDPDTGAHHLGCVAAGCGIVLDARKHGTLVDNRPPKGQNVA